MADFSFTQKFVSGEASFGFWGLVSRGLGLINTFFILSALSVYQYGVFQLLLSLYAFLTFFISWGGFAAGTDILRFIGENKEPEAKRLFWETYIFRLINTFLLWAIFFFGAPFLSFRYGADFIGVIRILSFLFWGEYLVSLTKFLLSSRLNFAAVASRDTLGKVFQLGVLFYFATFSTLGIREVFISVLAAPVLSSLTLLPASRRALEPWRGIEASRKWLLWHVARAHGKWASARSLFSQFVNRAQPWLIKFFISTEAVGIYSVAYSLADFFTDLVPTNTLATLIPRGFADREKSRRIFIYGVKYFILGSILLVLAAWLFVPLAVEFFFAKYIPSLVLFFFLVALLPVKIFWQVVDTFLVARRDQKFIFFRMLSRSAAALTLLLVLLPYLGLWGVLLTEVLLVLSIAFISYRRFIGLEPSFRLALRPIFSYGNEDKILIKSLYENFKRLFA
jgi:O-antigen/teichoic acid export membrane protein